jgi:hypothetical protein
MHLVTTSYKLFCLCLCLLVLYRSVESHLEKTVIVFHDGVVGFGECVFALIGSELREHLVVEAVQTGLDVQAVCFDSRRVFAVQLTQQEELEQAVKLALQGVSA